MSVEFFSWNEFRKFLFCVIRRTAGWNRGRDPASLTELFKSLDCSNVELVGPSPGLPVAVRNRTQSGILHLQNKFAKARWVFLQMEVVLAMGVKPEAFWELGSELVQLAFRG